MYAATVTLKRSEAQFWRMTPRKLSALIKKHAEINNPEGQENNSPKYEYNGRQVTGFVDQVII